MVPRDFFQNFGVPISWENLSQLSRWVFLGPYYPLKGPRCIKTPRVFKTIKFFCTNDRLQLIITFLESIRIHQNQNKMVKWTSRYCPILKLLETVEDFAFHKHNYHSVPWSIALKFYKISETAGPMGCLEARFSCI